MFRRCCSHSWLAFSGLIFLAAVGLSVWNIILSVRTLDGFKSPPCGEIFRTFLIGSIAASAVVILLYGFGLGAIYVLVWALLGQMWYNEAQRYCRGISTPLFDVVHTSLIILWFDLAAFGAFFLAMCVGCWCSMGT